MRVICFGDSLTSCGGECGRYSDILQDRFPDHEIVNKGVGGETFVDAKARLADDVLSMDPDIVLVEFGANDWHRDERQPQEWADDLDDILQAIVAKGAEAVVLGVFGLYQNSFGELVEKTSGTDERAHAYRELEKAVTEKHGCSYIPNIQLHNIGRRTHWTDSNHPNENGNRYVADTIEPVLHKLLQTKPKPIRKPGIHTMRDMWLEAVQLQPDKVAVIDGDQRLTYREADVEVQRLAAGLAQQGCEPGARIAVFMPNCLEYFLLYWAAVRINVAIVPINTWLNAQNIDNIFTNIEPNLLVANSAADKTVLAVAKRTNTSVFTRTACDGYADLDALKSDEPAPLPNLRPDDISIIMHTSGTTAAPKGAIMRHVDLMFNVMTAINAHQFVPSDIHLICNPMFHCTALYSSLPTAAYTKATCVITASTNPHALMDIVERERITTFLSIPSIFQRISSLPDITVYDHSSLRVIAYAGSVMPVSTIRLLQLYFPDVKLHNFFGLTETISMTHVLKGEDAEERPDSIGRLLPFVDAIVVDENDKPCGPDQIGELLFARENVICSYFSDASRLEKSICEVADRRWFRTGDLAAVDSEGYFFIKGRRKDMIIVGGENVFAAEVEAVLMSHDLIKEAAIKGIPATGVRESLGEMIRAYVVPRDSAMTETDVRRHCHENLASFKIPHEVVFLGELPRNPSGKVIKSELA